MLSNQSSKDSIEVGKDAQHVRGDQNKFTLPVNYKSNLSVKEKNAVLDQVSVKLEKAVGEGVDKINIKLFPPKLGSVDVRVEMPTGGQAKLFFSADKIETLHVLKQEVYKLEQALQRVGIETGTTPQFDLKGESQQHQEQPNNKFYTAVKEASNEPQIDDVVVARYLEGMDVYDFFGINSGVDIRA